MDYTRQFTNAIYTPAIKHMVMANFFKTGRDLSGAARNRVGFIDIWDELETRTRHIDFQIVKQHMQIEIINLIAIFAPEK